MRLPSRHFCAGRVRNDPCVTRPMKCELHRLLACNQCPEPDHPLRLLRADPCTDGVYREPRRLRARRIWPIDECFVRSDSLLQPGHRPRKRFDAPTRGRTPRIGCRCLGQALRFRGEQKVLRRPHRFSRPSGAAAGCPSRGFERSESARHGSASTRSIVPT